ncbi:hypothetical protein [Kitasatospora sp. NPDC059827]|uniref:hypothetical protein n=1 Tax=Kitasatospora sp. NPDC059827 TaxID=3346964 RepID=UPI00364BF3E0
MPSEPGLSSADAQATHWSGLGCPVHRDSDGRLRASAGWLAGWLLEFVGCRPGQTITEGVRCSERRTPTVTAHGNATATAFAQALADPAIRVEAATSITLRPEPTRMGWYTHSP